MAFSTFQLLYVTLSINKVDELGLSNTVHCNAYQEDQGNMVLATEGTLDSSHKMERFNYEGERTNV